MLSKALAFVVMMTLAGAAVAADAAVTFTDTNARPTPGKVGVAFFTATSTVDDAIVSVKSDCCDAVEIHRTEKFNGVMSMRRIPQLTLSKNKPVLIQPESKGGEHVMLIGLKKPLAAGDAVKVDFTFKKAPPQTVSFPVAPATAAVPAEDSHAHH
jgi:copper(I)-binding protein